MANDDRKSTTGEEYQYPNEEYVAETTPLDEKDVPPKPENFFIRLIRNNRRITLVIVLVVVALIGFKLVGLRHHTVETPAPQPVAPAPVVPSVSATDLVNEQLSTLKRDAQSNEVTMTQLQNQIADLRNTLQQNQAGQTQLTQSVALLAEQVKQLAAAAVKPAPVVHKKVATPPPIVFHLRAVVPGRAWIVSNDGLSESVTVGNTVPQYGTVQAIDANRGMVLTDSGKVIQYGENDR